MSEFRFKQFSLRHERSAMKVGTDGVLVGAWAPLDHSPGMILDIGAGTGLISLMVAQRTDGASIDAIEVDGDSFEECVANFEQSPWWDRLFCYHCSFGEFVEEVDDRYDLIVSNPPFHGEETGSASPSREKARRRKSLPPEELLSGVAGLLTPEGIFCLIWPYQEEALLLEKAREAGLHPKRITRVRARPDAGIKRSLLALGHKRTPVVEDTLVIEADRLRFSDAYTGLVRDFYLNL